MTDKKEVFKDFMNRYDVLIVDKNPSSRNRLSKTMYDLGAARHKVHAVCSLLEAEAIVNEKRIGIVLSDYIISGGSGFDLFKMIRSKNNPENSELCLVLVTANISQTGVAKAAEEDVDSFIIKPYTVQSIQENLVSTVFQKVKPSEYIVKIQKGKDLIHEGKIDEAITILKEAIPLHSKPALALFYKGQAEYIKEQANIAEIDYNQGLSFNNIHFKCLIGLFELFMQRNMYLEAYEVVKKVAKYFPANPDRLTQVVRLTVQTKNYEDMQLYYEIFTQLDERSHYITNYMGAGMYVAGKYCLYNNKQELGLKFFDNIAVSCSEHTKFIRAMITFLVDRQLGEEAMKYLSRFPVGHDQHEDFIVSDYLVNSSVLNNPNLLVKAGLEVYNRKIKDYQCMLVLIIAMTKAGHKEDKIAPFKKEIQELWPGKKSA